VPTVTELLEAVNERIALLHRTTGYFTEIESQTSNEKKGEIKSNIHSDEEITMIRDRWIFSMHVEAVDNSVPAIRQKLFLGKKIRRADGSDGAGPSVTDLSNPRDTQRGQRLILEGEKTHSSLTAPVVSFWKSFMQSTYTYLTMKFFV
jgi:hypothetical protein